MTVPFVHSNFDRVPDDYYPTIDRRCVTGLLQRVIPTGEILDVCAPQGSGIVDALASLGYNARCFGNAFAEKISAHWIITNPPYSRPLVDQIMRRQIQRVESEEVFGLAVLLRANFDFAKSREDMFNSPYYYGQVKLRFRPWWSEDRKAQPIHNFVWHVWYPNFNSRPIVLYADGLE